MGAMTAPQPRQQPSEGIADTLMFQRFAAADEEPKGSIFTKVWFWAVVAVVIAAIVVVAILLTR
jgi:anti-sigma-K factor RskA